MLDDINKRAEEKPSEGLFNRRKINKVSVDFDGVLMRMFLDTEWVKFNDSFKKRDKILLFFDKKLAFAGNYLMRLIHKFRKMTGGVSDGLKFFSEKFDNVFLLTSRRAYLADATIEWLKLHNLYSYFSGMFFREGSKLPWDFKADKVGELNVDMHVDDDRNTIKVLSEKYKEKFFVYFNCRRKKELKADNIATVYSWGELLQLFN